MSVPFANYFLEIVVQHIEVTLAAIGEGAQIMECKSGPLALREHISKLPIPLQWGSFITSDASLLEHGKLAVVEEYMPRLANAVHSTLSKERFPLVIGGDHSCAIGTWSAIANFYRTMGDIGLIWIDAHLDSHTPQTSESGAPHGMPLACLLGYGSRNLTTIHDVVRKLRPQNVVVIGARSSEKGEEDLLESLGVRVMRIEEVHDRGFDVCLDEAIEIVSKETVGYGITFDIDSLDPIDAPGVGSPEDGGLWLSDVVRTFESMNKRKLIGFELVEYNPERDSGDLRTAKACVAILDAILP
jgi:arginase